MTSCCARGWSNEHRYRFRCGGRRSLRGHRLPSGRIARKAGPMSAIHAIEILGFMGALAMTFIIAVLLA
jgi:hypothetical protein